MGCITGEVSLSYIFDPAVPERVAKHKPYVKLIVVLRNPADRAYSHYYHNKSRDAEPLSFRQAIDAESGRVHYAKYREWLDWSYLARGRYVEQLKRWFQYFSREQFYIIRSESLFEMTEATMVSLFAFLGLEPFAQDEYQVYNKQKYRVYQPTYGYLVDYFKSYNQQLYELLECDFGWND